MRIDVHFTPAGLVAGDLAGRGVVVIDALRATTTVITALANGAKAVIPAASSEEAVRLASNLEKDGVVLAGERKSVKIEGFALGNSPREMTAAAVGGKTIVLATTNGTPALVAAQGGDPVLVGAPVNFKALAERARAALAGRGDLVIVCAGRDKQFAIEDAYTAGVIIKAAAGGGGKGMRVAQDEEQYPQAFSLAKQEALAAFGSDEVYLEKYLARPRHIEIQLMGDMHGRVMHLCERDCSVQRRHQKLIEEAPSPAVDQTLRQAIGDSAVRLAEAIGYVGAGTIEFLLDEDGSFYFMEMNTRIQVEHPVTEMTTNFDLVKEQIRVAAGEPLSFVMNGHRLRGHAIECRVNAEDPARNFQPSPGTITVYHPPGGPGVRVDTHIYAGYTVPPYYDSLLAKLIVHGNSRTEALARMRQALDSFIIEGVTTTIPFLSRVMRHPDFVAGRVDTKFLEREPQLLQAPT
ncbi:MAG: ATP-grasp domain-containing protein [Gemmatimonadetes bacterium]|nr:MAG: ATP-grasp domain-containing protein [Gemmatimonadota bacterium]